MAIAKDATSSAHAQGASSLSWSHTCSGSNRLLIVHSGTNGTPVSTTGVTYNSVALTSRWSTSQNWTAASGWSLVAPATGANTVAITLSAAEDTEFGQAISYTGVDQTTPHGTSQTASGVSASPAVPTITSATGEVVVGFIMTSDTAITTGSGQTAEITDINFASDSAETDSEPGATSVDMTWTTAGSQWSVGAIPIKPAAGGTTVAVGQVTESDLAQTIVWSPKRRLLNQAVETNTAQALVRAKSKTFGQVSETDLAQTITPSGHKIITVGQVIEVDIAQAVTTAKRKVIGQVSENDTAQAIARIKSKVIAQATETDAAQAVTARKIKSIGQVTETDTALGAAHVKRLAVNQVIEIDIARAIVWAPKRRLVARVIEVDAAQTITVVGGTAPVQPEILETIIVASPNLTTVTAISIATQVTAASLETRVTQRLIETGVQSG